MALPDISLAQFNKIASGDYNAGQIDFKTNDRGETELVKINNHVWRTSKNNVILSPERILEVKEMFLSALEKGGVPADKMAEIRDRLGLPSELNLPDGKDQRDGILKMRFTPLTRAQVRSILDEYANGGKGCTPASAKDLSWDNWEAGQRTANMGSSNVKRRDNANMASMDKYAKLGRSGVNYGLTDAMSLLSASRSLSSLGEAQDSRATGANAINDRLAQRTALKCSFQGLVTQALKMLPASVRESGEFKLCGETVNLVKGDDGNLTAVFGKGSSETRVPLKMDADTFASRLIGRTVADADTLGSTLTKNILVSVYDRDLEGGLVASEKSSLTRQFASLVLANKSGDKVNFDLLVNGDYNTGILVEMAQRAINGEDVGDCKAKLDNYHAKLVSDNTSLPKEIREKLEVVANIPLERPSKGDGEMIVKAPIAGNINKVVQAMPPQEPAPVPAGLKDIGGLEGVKDFIADLVFSDDTMVGDVTVNKAGEPMRKILTNDKNIVAFAEIIKNPSLVKTACAQQIADVIIDGFTKMSDIIGEEFKKATGKTLADAAKENDFVSQLSQFLKDPTKMLGSDLAKFDNLILTMANKGCEQIQKFINNDVFKVGNASGNIQGSLLNDPYKNLEAKDIKSQLDGKGLNQILDSASNADSPGQVGFFKQVISNYFTSLANADKRSCFSAALKYAPTFDFSKFEGEAKVSAQKAAINKFTGAILKGTSPLLQKMMQGLPKDIMGDYADALDDMKSSLAPIPRKIVQAHFMQMIKDSQNKPGAKKIESIELVKSLGAASVGEAFLCKFTYHDKKPMTESYVDPETHATKSRPVLDNNGDQIMEDVVKTEKFVVKIMRHDAERRVKAEAEIFTAAAEKIGPGMAKTWEGQLNQYMTEFDFRNEAKNVEEGVKLYNIAENQNHPLNAIAPDVKSMELSDIAETKKDVMVAKVADGRPVDKFFKENITGIRNAASAVFEQDPATGRIKWVDGPIDPKTQKPKKVPVVKQNLPGGAIPNMIDYCRNNYKEIKSAQQKLIQATKAWFHEALLGSGKFHGDTHAGNLMIGSGNITFIDFGNLYELKPHYVLDENNQPVKEMVEEEQDGVKVMVERNKVSFDERHELLRVMMGVTFRDKAFVIEGFRKLLSEEGKVAFDANLPKINAILDSILSKGRFSYDMVYRLNAAVSELQKLGLELPPQINCFVQSMARLSNTLAEMNTILNQTSELLDAADGYIKPGSGNQLVPTQRDELDLLGKALDFRASADGQKRIDDIHDVVGLSKDGKPVKISAYYDRICSEEFGGTSPRVAAMFREGGSYHTSVVNRIMNAADPLTEATKLDDMLRGHADAEHNISVAAYVGDLDLAFTKFQTDLAAAKTPEEKKAAVTTYATHYCSMLAGVIQCMQQTEENLVQMRTFESVEKPSSFANAVMTTLLDSFDALETTFESSRGQLIGDVLKITTKELGVWFGGEEKRINAIKNDALKMAGDDSYQIDIGV